MTSINIPRGERATLSASSCPRKSSTHVEPDSVRELDRFDETTGELLTEHEPSIREELTSLDELSAERAPLFNMMPDEVVTALHMKRSSVHVAQSLALSPELDQAMTGATIFTCADRLRLDDGKYRALRRCKRRVCSYCAHIESIKVTARLKSALGFLPFRMRDEAPEQISLDRQMIALKITLTSGEVCELGELSRRIDALHTTYPRLFTTKLIKENLIGHMRATEVTQHIANGQVKAHPHIHSFALYRASCDIEMIKRELRSRWYQVLGDYYDKAGLDVDISASVLPGWLEELSLQTADDLLSWSAYITKGSYNLGRQEHRDAHSVTTPEYWSAVEEHTRSARLHQSYGLLKKAVKDASDEHKANKARGRRGRPRIARNQPDDLVYSHALKDYLRSDQLREPINPHAFTSSLDRLRLIPNFSALWSAERQAYELGIVESQNASLWRALALRSIDDTIAMIKLNRELFLIDSRKVSAERARTLDEPSLAHRELYHGSPVNPIPLRSSETPPEKPSDEESSR
jgi:hypothetical protein